MIEYKKILSCWHKLEYFSSASLPKGKYIEELNESEPWNIPITVNNPNKTIEYTIYLGVFDSLFVSNFIREYFKDDEKDENERNSKICFACLKLDIDGNYINDSIGISALPWALSQLEKGEIDSDNWSKSFEQLKEILIADFEYIFNTTTINEKSEIVKTNNPISFSELKEIESKIERLCDWSFKPQKTIYVKCDEKFRSKNNNSTADILNSFYTRDLECIISNINKNNIPKAFKSYLDGSLNKKTERIDLAQDVNLLQRSLSPMEYPDGCWPSEFTLSLMQQFAANNIFNNLSELNQEGLFSVNGPPGTGKTTLLRDVIAPILVKRAKALSEYENPAEAFTRVGEIKINENFTPFIYSPDVIISNGGIVVASSNNGAVENISKELPLKQEVTPYSQQISYFKDVAENCICKDNWGLISSVLGNKQNRSELVSNLWFNKDFSDLQKTLKNNKVDNNSNWEKIVIVFNEKLNEVSTEKLKLEKYKQECEDFVKVSRKKKELEIKVNVSKVKENKLLNKLNKQQGIVELLNNSKKEILAELSVIKQSKPNFFIYWFNRKIRKEYKLSYQSIFESYNSILKEIQRANSDFQETQVALNEISELVKSFSHSLASTTSSFYSLSNLTAKARKELGRNYADNEFWKNIESKDSQQSCPWYSADLKKLQSELFIISLKLQEHFILNANSTSSRISTTLAGFFEYLKGDIKPSKEEVKAMWNTFFMVIPVVSSTFASVQKMFKDLDAEDIPWLFIDEAGQAIPQAAAGAIWRSKRVVVVGDPFQIEPVVSISKILTNNISNYFELSDTQINSELSVQSMADRVNPLGAYINIDSKDIWVGIPLRVHRRCLSPMFDISNSIAYNNTMYSATAKPKEIGVSFENSFIHCEGSVDGRHFVEPQAEIIKDILIKEIGFAKKLPDIFVITPFSEISYKLKSFLFKPLMNEIKNYNPNIDSDIMGTWLKTHIGTVHTFQGKQAEGVILCLGLDEKTKGAANWASMKPNLLNVAVTRAKYRFTAVGDEKIWMKQPYFKELRNLSQN